MILVLVPGISSQSMQSVLLLWNWQTFWAFLGLPHNVSGFCVQKCSSTQCNEPNITKPCAVDRENEAPRASQVGTMSVELDEVRLLFCYIFFAEARTLLVLGAKGITMNGARTLRT